MPDLPRSLMDSLDEALGLLSDFASNQPIPESEIRPPAKLLEQCEEICNNRLEPQPVRIVHHFACTGGTLICKLLATMPNTLLLSEIDPLSQIMTRNRRSPAFAPTDLIYGMRVALRPADDAAVIEVFTAGLRALYTQVGSIGQRLVLRDHSHSHFCTDIAIDARPSLREIVQSVLPVLSIVTVRHPVDSFVSLDRNGWRHFAPFTIDEYAQRYLAFLERHKDIPMVRYEDLLQEPIDILRRICTLLNLSFSDSAKSLLSVVAMSGDSGRSSNVIGHRPRGEFPGWIKKQAASSAALGELCAHLGYEAAV